MALSASSQNKYQSQNEGDSEIDDQCCKEIAQCEMPQLKQLDLSHSVVSEIGLKLIFGKKWAWLKSINLRTPKCIQESCYVSEHTISKIDKLKQPLLQILNIYDCPISGNQLFDLGKNLGWEKLQWLKMGFFQISKEQVETGLFNICLYQLPKLKILQVHNSHLSKHSIKHLIKAKWNNLSHLCLIQCRLQNQSMKVLVKGNWLKLEALNLSCNYINDGLINYLTQANWPTLLEFFLYTINEEQKHYLGPLTFMETLILSKLKQTILLNKKLNNMMPKVIKQSRIFK